MSGSDPEAAPRERTRNTGWRPTRFQIFRYAIYALLTANLLYYLWEDIVAFRYLGAGATQAGAWLLVVLFMEREFMLDLRDALSKRRLIVFKTVKGILYLSLLANAIYWNVYGAFIDYWDAYLWLLAFVMIDLDLFKWDDGAAGGNPVSSAHDGAHHVQGGHSPPSTTRF